MVEEKQGTLEQESQRKENFAKTLAALRDADTLNGELQMKINRAMDRVDMLEQGLELKTTSTQRIVKEDQDSIEIGAQSTGRVKVYGNFKELKQFSEKVAVAIQLLEATREKINKMDVNGGK